MPAVLRQDFVGHLVHRLLSAFISPLTRPRSPATAIEVAVQPPEIPGQVMGGRQVSFPEPVGEIMEPDRLVA